MEFGTRTISVPSCEAQKVPGGSRHRAEDRAVGITEVVRRISVGAADHVPFMRVTNLARTMDELKNLGIWLVGTSDRAKGSLFDVDLNGPVGIVMGAEAYAA